MFYILLMSITAVVAPVSGSCTNTSIHKAQMCTAQLTGQNSANAFITQGDAERAVLACRNGDLLTAVNCIERVMTECKNDNTDAAHFLRNMIDIDKSRRSVQFFCTNVQVYVANAECIARHHKDQDICAKDAIQNFETQLGATSNMDVLMRFQCILYHVVVDCVEKVLNQYCSSEAADIVKTVIVGVQPPICAPATGNVQSERAGTYDVDRPGSASILTINMFFSLVMLTISSFLL